MDEFELIQRYFASSPCAQGGPGVLLGIGDDCALLELPAGEQLAVSTDSAVAGVHFPLDSDGFLLGQRVLAAAASDLAAMGAAPLGFTLAITLPSADAAWLERLAQGIAAMASRCQLALIGGDTTRGPLSFTITVFGRLPRGQALTRAGARPGDLLCVSGPLGLAAGALPLVLGREVLPEVQAAPLLARYWTPMPCLALGMALRGRATAAQDISDGLLADCGHVARRSGVALHIERERLPLSAELVGWRGEAAAADCALAGGDDYELVFTLPPTEWPAIHDAWPATAVIGRVEAGEGVHLWDSQGLEGRSGRAGFQHFGDSQ